MMWWKAWLPKTRSTIAEIARVSSLSRSLLGLVIPFTWTPHGKWHSTNFIMFLPWGNTRWISPPPPLGDEVKPKSKHSITWTRSYITTPQRPPGRDLNSSRSSITMAHVPSSMGYLPTWECCSEPTPLEPIDPSESQIKGCLNIAPTRSIDHTPSQVQLINLSQKSASRP